MVLALIFAFSFIGCANGTASAALEDDDTGDEVKNPGNGPGTFPQTPQGQTLAQWASELEGKLGDAAEYDSDTKTMTLVADVTISTAGNPNQQFRAVEPAKEVDGFAIHPDGTLVVSKGITLKVERQGQLNTQGTLKLEAKEDDTDGGKFVVAGGTAAVTGAKGNIVAEKEATITVSGGTLTVASQATVTQAESSKIEVSGGTLTVTLQATVTQAESSKIEVSSGSLAVEGTVKGAGTEDKVDIKVTGGSLSVETNAKITGKEVTIEAGGTSADIKGTITGTDKVDVKVSVANATVAANIESKEVVVTAAAAGVTVTGTVAADKVELAQEGSGTLTVDETADLTVKDEIKLTSGEESKPIEINTEVKAPEGQDEAPKVVADVPPTGSGSESLTFDSDKINSATKGSLVKNVKNNVTSYYIFVTTVADEESHYKGPLSGKAVEIAAKLDEANPNNLGYFDMNVTAAGVLEDTEGVVLVSRRIAAGTSISDRNVVTIPSFSSGSESFADANALASATPVYIEDYATSTVSEYGQNSTILVKGGAFVFVPYRNGASTAKTYGKQNYNGIVRVEAGGALLDQGAEGFSVGPAGYWFEYGSIALIQAYKDLNGKASGYNDLKVYTQSGIGDGNGLWIAPDAFKIDSVGAYGVWDTSNDVAQVNGSGSFVWVAGSTFGVNGHLTIARNFALSQDLKILPDSKVTLAGMLALGYPDDSGNHSIKPIALSEAEMAPLDLSGGATGGQTIVLNQGKAIVEYNYNSSSPSEKIVAPGASDPTTYVPGTGPTGYIDVFPWDVQK
jgi:hypothetical protein